MSAERLADLRRSIDGVDGALVALLARRFQFVTQLVEAKKPMGLPASIPARAEEVIAQVKALAIKEGFPPDTAQKMWRLLINEMIKYEEMALKGIRQPGRSTKP